MTRSKKAADIQARRWNNIGRLLGGGCNLFNDRTVEKVRAVGFDDFSFAHRLVRIMNVDGTNINVLAKRAGMTPQAMGRLVRRVADRGYVHIEQDQGDGRAKRVMYTQKGFELVDAALDAITTTQSDIADKLGEQDMSELRRILSKLVDDEPEMLALKATWDEIS
jgi:DNA-binding MarR family transcriptional regulator